MSKHRAYKGQRRKGAVMAAENNGEPRAGAELEAAVEELYAMRLYVRVVCARCGHPCGVCPKCGACQHREHGTGCPGVHSAVLEDKEEDNVSVDAQDVAQEAEPYNPFQT